MTDEEQRAKLETLARQSKSLVTWTACDLMRTHGLQIPSPLSDEGPGRMLEFWRYVNEETAAPSVAAALRESLEHGRTHGATPDGFVIFERALDQAARRVVERLHPDALPSST